MYGIVEAACALGDPATAAAAYRLLAPFDHLPMTASLGVACFGSTHLALGVACLTTGDHDAAVRHLRAAVHDNWALGHFPAVALSRSRLAQALALRAGQGDIAEAQHELRLARQEAAGLGMTLPAAFTAAVPPPGQAADPPSRGHVITCRRHGTRWRVTLGQRAAVVDHSVGMSYLAALVANPGTEIPAVDLAVGPRPADAAAARGVVAEGVSRSAQPVLDETAKQAYRQRLAGLQADIDEYERRNDLVRAERVRSERAWLIDELAAATGLRGRLRQFSGNAERARVSVGKAIRRSVEQVGRVDPVIAEELRACVRTGIRCCYLPRPAGER
jgi:hypothetical protein